MKLFLALLFVVPLTTAAQPPQVPHKMQFAGITLTIRDDARREIQKDVDALTQSPKHFNIKVERAKTYFPIIEKIFEEERVPDDFKYLSLQESSLISDAVSVSNAVGFWQFKDYTALEMGLRVDKEIDERMNIVSATRGAARYIKKNNFFFNNWVYALQAYQMGAGGVMKSVSTDQQGAKHMEITSATYWYVKKYIAHKIAFEDAVNGVGQIQVITYDNTTKKILADLATEVSVSAADLQLYNKWAKKGIIPGDRSYAVLIPVVGQATAVNIPTNLATTIPSAKAEPKKSDGIAAPVGSSLDDHIHINGIAAIKAKEGENAARLSERALVDLSDFLKWNDLSISDRIEPNHYYLLGKKRTRATEAYHKVTPGENLWQISQQYGVQLKKLKKYNRLEGNEQPKAGSMVWLSAVKPKDVDQAVLATEIIQVDKSQTFSWEVTPEQQQPADLKSGEEVPTKVENMQITLPPTESLQLEIKEEVKPDSIDRNATPNVALKANAEHTVKAGETLYAIAQLYHVSVMDLVTWNNLNLQTGIKPGQVLKLSGAQPIEESVETPVVDTGLIHVVTATDTLYSIARKYGVTIKELMEWNGKQDFAVTVGEKLKVSQK